MSIMPCYPDERAVENELGGKWELFFEETREETGNVGLEWDKDFDEVPLNLNGFMVVVNFPEVPSSNAIFRSYVNTIQTDNFTAYSTTQLGILTVKAVVKNGLLDKMAIRSNASGVFNVQLPMLIDNITQFGFTLGNVPRNSTIQVYVLRGV